MALTKFTTDVENITKLDDQPNIENGLSASELKAKFDKGVKDTKTYLNDVLTPEIDTELATLDTKIDTEAAALQAQIDLVPQAISSNRFPTVSDDDKAVSNIWTIPSSLPSQLTNLLAGKGKGDSLSEWLSTTNVSLGTGDNEGYIVFNSATTYRGAIGITFTEGKKYYTRLIAKGNGGSQGVLRVSIADGLDNEVQRLLNDVDGTNTSERIESNLIEAIASGDRIWFYRGGTDAIIYVKEIMVLCLTDLYGAGNEPTKEEMDNIINELGYFDNNSGNYSGRAYLCTSNATGAAVWKEISFV